MKDYEKAAIAIGAAALGLAGYQAMKTKEAVDAHKTTDTAKDPVTAAVDLTRNVVGGVGSWFRQRYDDATGKTKGRSDDVIDVMSANPASPLYMAKKTIDFGKDAAEAGTKYLYSFISRDASSGKEKIEPLTNKPFTLMGSFAENFTIARLVPGAGQSLDNIVTGIGSKLEYTTKKGSDFKTSLIDKAAGAKNWVLGIFGR